MLLSLFPYHLPRKKYGVLFCSMNCNPFYVVTSYPPPLTSLLPSLSPLSILVTPITIFILQHKPNKQISYSPGTANTDFAKKYGHLAGTKVRTVGEAFTEFTDLLGTPVNALYKGICTDLVGSLHLIKVNARFQKDAVFSLGLVSVLDLVLKNYPEQDTAKRIKSAMIKSAGMDEAQIDAEAATLMAWAQGKTTEDVAAALRGEGGSALSTIALGARNDEYWMYSRFFGIGLIKMMEIVGVEQDMSVAYDVMENWMGKCLGKPYYTACVSFYNAKYLFCRVKDMLRLTFFPCARFSLFVVD